MFGTKDRKELAFRPFQPSGGRDISSRRAPRPVLSLVLLPKDAQPVHRQVEHLCHLLIWQVQGGPERVASDYTIDEKMVERYMKASSGGSGT